MCASALVQIDMVSMTSAIPKWLESRSSVRCWSCPKTGSSSGLAAVSQASGFPSLERRGWPTVSAGCCSARSATRLGTETNVDRLGTPIDARIWFPQEPEGMVAREMHRSILSSNDDPGWFSRLR